MARLIAKPPCAELLPVTVGAVTLAEVAMTQLTSVAPFAGKAKAVGAALKVQTGAGLPAANRRSGPVTWCGHGQWMVAAEVKLDGLAAVTDQSDAWAVVALTGDNVVAVLARLCPVDLRASVFKTNHVARTMIGHMTVTIIRTGPNAFEIMGMRSMAGTLVHELSQAMQGLAARG